MLRPRNALAFSSTEPCNFTLSAQQELPVRRGRQCAIEASPILGSIFLNLKLLVPTANLFCSEMGAGGFCLDTSKQNDGFHLDVALRKIATQLYFKGYRRTLIGKSTFELTNNFSARSSQNKKIALHRLHRRRVLEILLFITRF